MSGPLSSSTRCDLPVISMAAGAARLVPSSASAATNAGAMATKAAPLAPFSSLWPAGGAGAVRAARRMRATTPKQGEVS